MSERKIRPAILLLVGLLSILAVAAISDRILWQLQRQARETAEFTAV